MHIILRKSQYVLLRADIPKTQKAQEIHIHTVQLLKV